MRAYSTTIPTEGAAYRGRGGGTDVLLFLIALAPFVGLAMMGPSFVKNFRKGAYSLSLSHVHPIDAR
jgi:hypothetical protein